MLQGPAKESWKTRKDPDLQDEERVLYPAQMPIRYCDGKKDVTRDGDARRLAQEIAYRVVQEKSTGT